MMICKHNKIKESYGRTKNNLALWLNSATLFRSSGQYLATELKIEFNSLNLALRPRLLLCTMVGCAPPFTRHSSEAVFQNL